MGNYVIGIGGTGARCIESIVHLSAVGLIPRGDLNLYFVDADKTNGNLVQAQETLLRYLNFKKGLEYSGSTLGNTHLFQTEIKNNDVWSPFSRYVSSVTLEDVFSYNSMDEEHQNLFELLYTDKKRKMKFENGFLGWPSVGSGVIAKEYNSFNELFNKISNDDTANVILVGSIFGGTGAAGIPTLAKLIKNSFTSDSKKLALILLLPYFSFAKAENEDDPNADSSNFKLKTKLALEYYHGQKLHDVCNAIFILSDTDTPSTSNKTIKGGENQKNNPHFIELYAGLFASEFFNNPANYNGGKYYETCRLTPNTIEWSDLPSSFGKEHLINTLGRFTTFSFAYCTRFYGRLKQCVGMTHRNAALNVRWYPQFFSKHTQDVSFFDNLNDYCSQYLKWIIGIQRSSRGQVEINLIKDSYITPPNTKAFGNLIHEFNNQFSSIDNLEHAFVGANRNNVDATGDLGKFIRSLYEYSL